MRKRAISYSFLEHHGIKVVKSKPVDEHDKDIIDKLIRVEYLFGTVYARVIDGVIWIATKPSSVLGDIYIAVQYLVEKQRKNKKKLPVVAAELNYSGSKFVYIPTLTEMA